MTTESGGLSGLAEIGTLEGGVCVLGGGDIGAEDAGDDIWCFASDDCMAVEKESGVSWS